MDGSPAYVVLLGLQRAGHEDDVCRGTTSLALASLVELDETRAASFTAVTGLPVRF
ncbi:MAG: hypothetical protein ACR2FG_07800 [Marmoricola sp.]